MNMINKSYFWSYDSRQGWNYTRIQSFWNDFYRHDENVKYLEITCIYLFALVSLIVNIYMISVLGCRKSLQSMQSKYIIGIMFCTVIWLPAVFLIGAGRLTHGWIFGDFSCRLSLFLTINTSFVKIVFMAIISIERYLNIVRGHIINPKVSSTVLVLAVLVVSGTTAFVSIPNTFTQEINYGNHSFIICTALFPYHQSVRVSMAYMITLFVTYFILPSIVISFCYSRILMLIKNSVQAINTHHQTYRKGSNQKAGSYIEEGQRHRTIVLVLMAVLFVVMWVSLFTSVAALTLDHVLKTFKLSSRLLIMSVNIALVNTIVEPLLYTLTSSEVRKEVLRCIKKIKNPRASQTENTTTQEQPR